MTRAETSATLGRWALEAGFDRAGVASLEPIERGGVFLRWLAEGGHAGMGYLAERVAERLEPAHLLAGARSVLCVALVYHPLAGDDGEPAPAPEGDLWPRVARYARGRDYHNLMGKRLRRLARRVCESFPGADARPYVDTGPVLERELAARAGLGVAGKNTCLLSREDGSWFLLGEVFTTLDLAPDQPLADLCGRCTRCLDACPTGALTEPYRLDAGRCISYWTIEHRGAIPAEARAGLGDWVFGCDVCQEVCPWNLRFEGRADRGGRRPAEHPDLRLPEERGRLDLAGLLGIGEAEYEEVFRGSAMKRARRSGLRRNAAIAMGNRGEARYVGALARALAEDEDAVVRGAAAWALGRIGGEAAREAL
ncbi:MAG TPA: tRNA epoxyqueuosine(34) reductase QueG, partial [Thermoanaerobaculia bacterium]|nr:tRNA epoxyqueuosine(34) reductase QueG [Thermoanaerobaculia bacterium]